MPRAKECTDHLGNKFGSKADMARHWGIAPNVYLARRSRGNNIEESLTHPIKKPRPPVKIIDHTGRNYKCFKDMAKAWNIDRRVVWARLYRLNWSIEKSLTTPVRHKDSGDLDCQG